MKPAIFTITAGAVERCDGEDNGTVRPTWRAWINLQFEDRGPVTVGGKGDGKAAHVALSRACSDALAKAGRQ